MIYGKEGDTKKQNRKIRQTTKHELRELKISKILSIGKPRERGLVILLTELQKHQRKNLGKEKTGVWVNKPLQVSTGQLRWSADR